MTRSEASTIREDVAVGGQRFSPRVLAVLAAIAGFVVVFCFLYFTSARFHAATSDTASLVLEGQSMAHGQVLLPGWQLTFASFWTSNAAFSAIAILIGGVRPVLLYAGPALAAAMVVAAGVVLAREGRRGAPAFAGGAAVVALLCFATPALDYFFVAHGFHVSTAAYALLAFVALRRARFGWGWIVAVLVLTVGMLGDLMMVAYAVIPLFGAGVAAALRERRWRAGLVESSAAVLSVVVAYVARVIFIAFGTFEAQHVVQVVSSAQRAANLGHAVPYFVSLLGLTNAVQLSGGVPTGLAAMDHLDFVHVIGACCVLVGLAGALLACLWGLVRGRKEEPAVEGGAPAWRLDNLLVIAVACSAVPFVYLATSGGGGIRYLTASALFAVVVAGRMVARLWPKLTSEWSVRAFATAGCALTLGLAASFGYAMSVAPPADSIAPLASWLEAHDLHHGIGDYWDASITTVESRGAVAVRPVGTSANGQIVRSPNLPNGAWYGSAHPFQFLVYGGADGVGLKNAELTWGKPEHVYDVGVYRVVVWSHPIFVPSS